jgi:hypothetical protein
VSTHSEVGDVITELEYLRLNVILKIWVLKVSEIIC